MIIKIMNYNIIMEILYLNHESQTIIKNINVSGTFLHFWTFKIQNKKVIGVNTTSLFYFNSTLNT